MKALTAMLLFSMVLTAGCASSRFPVQINPPTVIVTVEHSADLIVEVRNSDGDRPYPNALVHVRQSGDSGVTDSEGCVRMYVPSDAQWVDITVVWTNNCGNPQTTYAGVGLLRSTTQRTVWVDTRCIR